MTTYTYVYDRGPMPKSTEPNAFTHGYSGTPHGYVRGVDPKPTTHPKKQQRRGGFAKNSGTIPGLSKKSTFNCRTK